MKTFNMAFRSCSFIIPLFVFIPSFPMPGMCGAVDTNKIVIVSPVWDYYTNNDGTGIYFELMRRIFEPRGFRIEPLIIPWKRCKVMIQRAMADCMPGAYLTPDDPQWAYPRYPMGADNISVVFYRDKIKSWNGIESLAGKSVIWPRGYNFQNYFNVNVDRIETDSFEQAWIMLKMDRADFYMDTLQEIDAHIRNKRIDMDGVRMETVFSINTYLRFASGGRSGRLIEVYETEIERLYESGELESLYNKWNVDFPASAFSELEKKVTK